MSTGFIAEMALRILAIGAGATIVMDVWLLLLKLAGLPSTSFSMLGRWLVHWYRGTWDRDGRAKAVPVRGETVLGWTAHYAIGIAFAALLVLVAGPDWAREPTFPPALLAGVLTVLAPLFILQPAMGAGIASSRTPTPLLNNLRSLANHTVFGIGLYLAAVVTAAVTAAGPR